jgi:PAS domain S-box-containing protein
MISANTVMTGSYDYGEVARSIMIAIAASYAALDLAGRVTAAGGRARAAWLTGGAIAMGIGIWAMHFKALLAFRLPVTVDYHWPTGLVSFLVAVFASAVALYIVSRQEMGRVQVLAGSLIMGGGIAAMHYLGVRALRLAAVTRFSPLLVVLSIVLAIVFSAVALVLTFGLREPTKGTALLRKMGSAVVMGAAISAMHYTGMAATTFLPSVVPPNLSHAVSISPPGSNGVVIVTFIVLGAAILTSTVDRQTEVEVRRLNERLERSVVERTRQLAAANEGLRREIAERQRAEEVLRRSEDRLRSVIDTIPALVWSKLPDGSADFLNQRFREYTGLSMEDGLGEGWLKAIHPQDRASSIDEWRAAFAAGEPFEFESHLRRADGQYLWFLFRGAPFRDETGKIVKWYGSTTDIEDRKRAEEQSRALIDAIPQQIWSGPPDGLLDFCNLRWRAYMGLTQEELQGEGWQRMLHPDDRERVLKAWRVSVMTGTPYQQEERHRGADGEYRWFLARGVPLRDAEGCIVRWYGTNTDIEDRKRAEDELRKQKEILQKIFENMPVMIGFVGQDGDIELVNPEWERRTGWTLEEIREQNLRTFAGTYPDPHYRQMVQDFATLSTGEWTEVKMRVRDGRVIDAAVAVVHLSDGMSLGIGQDITERKRTEAALQDARANLARVTRVASMGELAAAIAHEVNQPLAAIVTNANFCLRELAGGRQTFEKLREAIEEIVNDGNRASAVISRIRAQLIKEVPERAELDINEIIQDVTKLLRNELTLNRVALRTELDTALPRLLGDRVQLQQVLTNLIMNGIDAMRTLTGRPRELLIRSAKSPDGVLVQVQDSGTGLDPEQVSQVFEPFFTTKPEGIGMGLSISRSIVESHEGRLWAESDPKGALFQFTLPTQD